MERARRGSRSRPLLAVDYRPSDGRSQGQGQGAVGRKNRKGRTPDQHPRRFYRSKREQRALDAVLGEQQHGGGPTADPAVLRDPAGATISALPHHGQWNAREIRPRTQARLRTCGHCAEWSARGGMLEAASRGQCLHPGSGFSYPPADTQACPFFH